MSAVRLGDHAKLIRGITFKPVDKCDPHDERTVVCMRTKNVQATLDASDLIAVPRNLVKNSEKMLSTGDILVSSANSWNLVGKCCQVPTLQYPSTAGAFISILRPKTEQLESSYLYRWFSSVEIQRRLRSFANQTTNISNLNHKKTLELQIPLPPLPEQKRIARILDAADALRVKRREALAQLDTLLQSTFIDMFGDPVTNPMGWEMVNGGRVSRRLTVGIVVKPASYYQPTGVPAIRSLNVRTNKIEIASLVYVSAENNEGRLKKTRVWKDDVLLVRSGQPGTAAVVPAELDGVNAIDILILTPDQHVAHPVYLSNYFNSAGGKRMVLGAQRGQIQKHLNVGSLRSAPIPLPPLDLQCRFSAIVESVECQNASQRAHLDELDTLFASLQSRAFRGDL